MPTILKTLTLSPRSFAAVCIAAAAVALCTSPFLVGCGGSSSGSAPVVSGANTSRGRAVFTVTWPPQTRLVPAASNSVAISLNGTGTDALLLARQVMARPASGAATVTFENMEPGSIVATASAFPTTDGTGVAQASGQVPLTIVADETAQTSLTMDSTIDRLEISPPAFRFYAAKQTSFTGSITVTPRNAAGEVVLVPKTNLKWTSSAPGRSSIITTTQGYTIFAGGPVGIITLTLKESESGKTAALPIDIHGPLYTITDLGLQIAFSPLSEAYAINATGAIAGYAVVNNRPQAVLWQNGVAQNLGAPSGTDFSYARDINDDGVAVGYGRVTGNNGVLKGFVWKSASDGTGQFIDVPPPPGVTTSPLYSINNKGQAAGGDTSQFDVAGTAFIYDLGNRTSTRVPSTSTIFPVTGSAINDSGTVVGSATGNSSAAYSSQNGIISRIPGLLNAYAINAAGVVAGYQLSPFVSTASIAQNNQTTILFPSDTSTNSTAYGLNNKGAVVGTYSNGNMAFVWGPGINGNPNESTPELLNYLIDSSGWQLNIARDINDRGEIVGVGLHNGRKTAFLLTPIP